MMDELKPCPFCGGRTELINDEEWYGILCHDCHFGLCLEENTSGADNETPVAQWNTRPIEDALRVRVAELEAGIRESRNADLVDLIYDLVAQSCGGGDGKEYDSCGISTYEEAIMLLVDSGRLRLVSAGRIIAVDVEVKE